MSIWQMVKTIIKFIIALYIVYLILIGLSVGLVLLGA
jgi:hypothetical protein